MKLNNINENSKIVIIATNEININTIFLNGLNQNIIILHKLFQILGYKCYILCNKKQENNIVNNIVNNTEKGLLKENSIINTQTLLHFSTAPHIFIEMGMSITQELRSYLRANNTKVVKLYLGNILNIDIETIQNMKNIFFNHHIIGDLDEIWTSPHYGQNLEYGTILNRCDIKDGKIAPYVWEPFFITDYDTSLPPQWSPKQDLNNTDIVIFDPTISFQKSYLYSLLLAEQYSQHNKNWKGNVIIINGDRISNMEHNRYNVINNLFLTDQKRIKFIQRQTIIEILNNYNNALFITNQYCNDFNYATLELLYCKYPVLHNSEGWENIGYNYNNKTQQEIMHIVDNALYNHSNNIYNYIAQAKVLYWEHSIYNPKIQKEWKELLF